MLPPAAGLALNPRLSRLGEMGAPPLVILACVRSVAEARTKLERPTAERPKSPARILVTAPLKRAFRYTLVMFVLLTIVVLLMVVLLTMLLRKPPNPRPYQGWNASNGARGHQPTLPNPNPNPRLAPKPGAPQPKNPTRAGLQ